MVDITPQHKEMLLDLLKTNPMAFLHFLKSKHIVTITTNEASLQQQAIANNSHFLVDCLPWLQSYFSNTASINELVTKCNAITSGEAFKPLPVVMPPLDPVPQALTDIERIQQHINKHSNGVLHSFYIFRSSTNTMTKKEYRKAFLTDVKKYQKIVDEIKCEVAKYTGHLIYAPLNYDRYYRYLYITNGLRLKCRDDWHISNIVAWCKDHHGGILFAHDFERITRFDLRPEYAKIHNNPIALYLLDVIKECNIMVVNWSQCHGNYKKGTAENITVYDAEYDYQQIDDNGEQLFNFAAIFGLSYDEHLDELAKMGRGIYNEMDVKTFLGRYDISP